MNITSQLKQTATHWVKSSIDGYGKPSFAAPVSRYCRWEDKKQILRAEGQEQITISTRVFLAASPTVGDYLYLGTSTASNPLSVSDAREIAAVQKWPSLSGTQTLYLALLKA